MPDNRIAIIGIAARFPDSPNVTSFWRLLSEQREGIRRFSKQEMKSFGVAAEHLDSPDYVLACPVIDNIDEFDASFFGIPGIEASIMDPQQRVFLELSWHALEDAACDPERFNGRIGVFAGCGPSTYLAVCGATRAVLTSRRQFLAMVGNDKDYLPTRVSYLLGLRGPSVNLNTACSSSLVSTHFACQSLLDGECDIALAGGVSLRIPAIEGYFHHDGGVHSPDGHCRAFDSRAAGTVDGAGAGIVVLQRLEDALVAGSPIRAVIAGSAVNNDGNKKVSFTSPSVAGQREAIREALAVAELEPKDIDLIEAHGTATQLGDTIEVEALRQAYTLHAKSRQTIALGSVKTNIGHSGAAAGIAGLIKLVLCLENELIAPQLHFSDPNPKLDLEHTPFKVAGSPKRWPRGNRIRRASVSSFGIGGTNAHVVVEESPPVPESSGKSGTQRARSDLLVLSARTSEALGELQQRFCDFLGRPNRPGLADIATTLCLGRQALPLRWSTACSDVGTAIADLSHAASNKSCGTLALDQPAICFLFPGQGAQTSGMLGGLYRDEPEIKEAVENCLSRLDDGLAQQLRDCLLKASDESPSTLRQTAFAQPALLICGYAIALWLSRIGVSPTVTIGHSVGELAANVISGVLGLDDALLIACERGRLLDAQPSGRMLAVAASASDVTALVDSDAQIAAFNAPDETVLSGPG